MSPVPVSTCPVLTLTQTAARHQQHAPPDSVPVPNLRSCLHEHILGLLCSTFPLEGQRETFPTFKLPHTLEAAASWCTKGFFSGWSSPRASSLQPAFISTTRINAAHKDAVINASRFLLSHHVLQQLVNTKGANRNCSKDCKRVKEISSSVCSLSSDGGIIN